MAGLVVKEKVRLELTQKSAFVQAAQKHGLVDLDIPVHQRADGALVGRGAARRHQRRAYAHGRARCLLQLVQGHQKGFEGAVGQRLGRFVLLVLLKGIEAMRLVDALGLVAKEHGVAVKSDAHLVRMRRAGVR